MFRENLLPFLVRGGLGDFKVRSSFYLFFPTAKWTTQFMAGKLDAGNNWETRST